jgi:hypothetical protein
MKLYEFFGHQNLDFYKGSDVEEEKNEKKKERNAHMIDDLFWFIVDHDKLHKEHFFKKADHIKEKFGKDEGHDPKIWEEMVKQGCVEFFHHHKMKGDIKELFDKEMRDELCQRLVDHYHKDIVDGSYKL